MYKIIAIVGLSKNAGKTSFLNWYVKNVSFVHSTSETPPIAITTTGRDGEDIDLVTGDKKPKVILPENVLFTSFEHIFNVQSAQIKAIAKLPFRVIGKDLWLFQTLGQIETEVVGPTTRKEQEALIEIFKTYIVDKEGSTRQSVTIPSDVPSTLPIITCPLPTIIVDGSLDRKSICLSSAITDIVLVIGASAGDILEINRQTVILKLYSQIPTSTEEIPTTDFITYAKGSQCQTTDIKSIYGDESEIIDILATEPDWIYFPGMLTETSWAKLKTPLCRYAGKVIFHHPISINIPLHELHILLRQGNLYTRIDFPLSAVAINSYSPYGEHLDAQLLKKEIKTIFPDKPVIDITEIY